MPSNEATGNGYYWIPELISPTWESAPSLANQMRNILRNKPPDEQFPAITALLDGGIRKYIGELDAVMRGNIGVGDRRMIEDFRNTLHVQFRIQFSMNFHGRTEVTEKDLSNYVESVRNVQFTILEMIRKLQSSASFRNLDKAPPGIREALEKVRNILDRLEPLFSDFPPA
jgi:hypothetical protein